MESKIVLSPNSVSFEKKNKKANMLKHFSCLKKCIKFIDIEY